MEENKYATSFIVDGQLFAIDTEAVRHILENTRPTPVPLTKPFVSGIINNHGTMMPVLDLRKLLDRKPDDTLREQCIIIIGVEENGKEEMVGLKVDEMDDVFEYSPDDFKSDTVLDLTPEVHNAVAGTIKKADNFVCLLKTNDLAAAML